MYVQKGVPWQGMEPHSCWLIPPSYLPPLDASASIRRYIYRRLSYRSCGSCRRDHLSVVQDATGQKVHLQEWHSFAARTTCVVVLGQPNALCQVRPIACLPFVELIRSVVPQRRTHSRRMGCRVWSCGRVTPGQSCHHPRWACGCKFVHRIACTNRLYGAFYTR